MTMKPAVFFAVGSMSLAGCGDSPQPGEESPAETASEVFFSLEDRLLQADSVNLEFAITAEGAIQVDLDGHLQVTPEGLTRIAAAGHFAGDSVDLHLLAREEEFEFGNWPERVRESRPSSLNEALFVGFMRMGILHNLARLVANAPPDRAEGGVRDWVQVDSLSFSASPPEASGSRSVSFSIFVGGSPAGTATLEIGPDGHPLVRRQSVQFPSGEMRVVERYVSSFITPLERT